MSFYFYFYFYFYFSYVRAIILTSCFVNYRVPDAPWDPDAQPEWRVTLGVDPDAGNGDDDAGDDADDGSVQSVNAKMVAAGLARLERWVRKDPAAKVLVNAETRARRDRVGMWEYGDVDSDDEEEERPKAPGAWGRRR